MTPANSNSPLTVRPTIWRGVLWMLPPSVAFWAAVFWGLGLI